MVRISMLDLFIFGVCAIILTWLWGWANGYDVATVQMDYITFIDKCQAFADALDHSGR